VQFTATAAASSELGGFDRLAAYTVNGSGLGADSDGDGIAGHGNAPNGTMWLSNNETTPWIRFDIQKDSFLDRTLIWNYNEVNFSSRGMRTATIKFASDAAVADGLNLSDPNDPLWTTLATDVPFTRADQSAAYEAVDEFFFGNSSVLARHVLIQAQTNFGDPQYTGLSEAQFFGQAKIDVAGVTASSQLVEFQFNRPAGNTIDGLGHSTTSPDGNPGQVEGMWLTAANDPNPSITFDLGGPHRLD
ncbi:MAG: hypothetical protein WD030_02500, partial [Pirellulales bacterium]